MRELVLKITLLEDVVVNARPANEGGHEGLDHLPGYLLMGAAAHRLYPELDRPTAWRLFHSGQVWFGDALPLLDDQPAWPIPFCWHQAKGQQAIANGRIDPTKVYNLQFGPLPNNAQPQQLREGYVSPDGRYVAIPKTFRMKTAIDPESGRVAESQLFGYESIPAGQTYVAWVRAPEALDSRLWERLVWALTAEDELLLGRSRSAEYGRVAVERLDWPVSRLIPESRPDPQGEALTLWCLSDLALIDAWGQPVLAPTPESLGLAGGEIDWQGSFLRFRRYAVWNAYRDGYDLERQVIQRGSIIRLRLDRPLTDAERAGLQAGVGLYRESGLGWVSLDPSLLSAPQPSFAAPKAAEEVEAEAKAEPVRPNHPLILWLEAEYRRGQGRQADEQASRNLRDALDRRYQLARRYAGVPEHLPIGPSPAQWGTIYEAARTHDSGDLAGLKKRLFEGADALCKPQAENWQDQFRDEKEIRSFHDWFKETAENLPSVQALRLFAREAQRVAAKHYRGERSNHQESAA